MGDRHQRSGRHFEQQARERDFRLIRREYYLSPNEARNLAVAEVRTKYIAFADNDVIHYSPGWLKALVGCAEETGADIVGPLICIGEPAHTKVHIAGGTVEFIDEGGRRRFKDNQRFLNRPLAEVAASSSANPAISQSSTACWRGTPRSMPPGRSTNR